MPSAHGLKRDRGAGRRVSRVEARVSGVGCRASSVKLRSTGVLEFWSNRFRKRFFHHSTNPILHHSILLPMTNRAARENFDFVLLYKLLPERNLVRRRLPIHAEDLFTRAHKALRAAMAFQTPLHIQGVHAPHERHLIYSTMASRTAHTLVHMDAMIEINESREIIHPRPLQRLAGPETLAHRRQDRALCPNLSVAIHADLRGWNAGERGLFHRGVAITAIDAVITHVVLVTELDRL